MSNTYNTNVHTFVQKRNEDIYSTILIDNFSLDPLNIKPEFLDI